jgi:hypothetical protein
MYPAGGTVVILEEEDADGVAQQVSFGNEDILKAPAIGSRVEQGA